MNRREFLKSALALAALSPITRLSAKAGADGDKSSDLTKGAQITRRQYKNTAMTLPLLGFGMMRLPRINSEKPEIDYTTAQKMFDRAMECGLNYFDTAYMYHSGLSEKCAGDLLSKYPRDSYYLADKMPIAWCKEAADVPRIFEEQLQRTKAGYFDFYLFHALDAERWETAKKFKVWEFLSKKKEEGLIRKLGFSFHDNPEVLQTIAEAHPWEFAQIQLNYMDWDLYKSKEQYEILTKLGIPVIIMEPLKGGSLVSLNDEATAVYKKADPKASTASWAFRFAGSLPNVAVVLSGMSLPEHLEDNIKTFTDFKALTDADRSTINTAVAAYRKTTVIPCTSCRYCCPCPAGVEIPRIFGLYNLAKQQKNDRLFTGTYDKMLDDQKATACVKCGLCMTKCPQKIDIPAMLEKITAEYSK